MDTSKLFTAPSWPHTTQNTRDTFAERSKKLFDQLKQAEENTQSQYIFPNRQHPIDNDDDDPEPEIIQAPISKKRKRCETRQFRGQESIFKRPEAPLARCLPSRRLAGFQRNPDKWVKYSLDDVSNDDLTNAANTAAALNFLREMEDRKSSGEAPTLTTEHDRILFKNTKKPKTGPTFSVSAIISSLIPKDSEQKPSFRSSKLVMPEYVVGQKDQRETKKKEKISKGKPSSGKELRLDHLHEDEETC